MLLADLGGERRWSASTRRRRGGPIGAALEKEFGLTEAELHRRGGRTADRLGGVTGRPADPREVPPLVVAVVGAVAFVALAVALVPWDPVPGGAPAPVPAPDTVFSRRADRAGRGLLAGARLLGWCSLVVSLLVACWLGFTRARACGWSAGCRGPGGCGWCSASPPSCWSAGWPRCPSPCCCRRTSLDYGLSTQALRRASLLDLALGRLVGVVATTLALLVVVGTARRWRTCWPAIAGGCSPCS